MVRRKRPEIEDATTDALEWFLSSNAPAEVGPLAVTAPEQRAGEGPAPLGDRSPAGERADDPLADALLAGARIAGDPVPEHQASHRRQSRWQSRWQSTQSRWQSQQSRQQSQQSHRQTREAARHAPRHPAPPPPAYFDPNLVASAVPARPRPTSGRRHPMLRMGEVIVATALVLLLSVGAVTSFIGGGIDGDDLTLPAREAAPRTESGVPPDSRANDNAAVDPPADGDAVFDDPAATVAPVPPAEATRRYPALRPLAPQPAAPQPAATTPAASTDAPASTPIAPPPDATTDPATPPADPAPAPEPAPDPPTDPDPGPAPEPPAGEEPAPDPPTDPVPEPDPGAPPTGPGEQLPDEVTVQGEPAGDGADAVAVPAADGN